MRLPTSHMGTTAPINDHPRPYDRSVERRSSRPDALVGPPPQGKRGFKSRNSLGYQVLAFVDGSIIVPPSSCDILLVNEGSMKLENHRNTKTLVEGAGITSSITPLPPPPTPTSSSNLAVQLLLCKVQYICMLGNEYYFR
jgi:hypothetical protein